VRLRHASLRRRLEVLEERTAEATKERQRSILAGEGSQEGKDVEEDTAEIIMETQVNNQLTKSCVYLQI